MALSARTRLLVFPVLAGLIYTAAIVAVLEVLPAPNRQPGFFDDWDAFVWPVVLLSLVHFALVLPSLRFANRQTSTLARMIKWLPAVIVTVLGLIALRAPATAWIGLPSLTVFIIGGVPTLIMSAVASRLLHHQATSRSAV
jgi:ABC-type dipeptide/oligopeptide/nickel transport system permease component